MASIDAAMEDLLQAFKVDTEHAAAQKSSLDVLESIRKTAEADQQAAIKAGRDPLTGKTPETISAEDQAQIIATRASLDSATHEGINSRGDGYILNQLIDRKAAATMDALDKAEALAKAGSTKFLDNPMQWVMDQFSMTGLARDADLSANYANQINAAIAQKNETVQSIAITNNVLKETVTAATAEATLKAVSNTIKEAAATAALRNYGLGVEGIKTFSLLDSRQLENQYKAFGVMRDQRHWELYEQSTRLTMKHLSQTMRLTDLNENAQNNIAEQVRAGLILATPGDKDTILKMPREYLYKMLTDVKDPAMSHALTLQVQSAPLGGVPFVSTQIDQVADALDHNPGWTLQPAQAPLIRGIRDARAAVLADKNLVMQANDLPPDQKKRFLTVATGKKVLQQAELDYNQSGVRAANSMYPDATLDTLVALKSSPLAGSALVQKVFSQTPGLMQAEINPDRLFHLGTEAVKAGKVSLKEYADGMAAIFQTNAGLNNVTKGYAGLGFKAQAHRPVALTNGLMGGTKQYDGGSSEDWVRAALTKEFSASFQDFATLGVNDTYGRSP